MARSSHACRCGIPVLFAVLGLVTAAGFPRVAGAQADSTASAFRLSVAAGPSLAARSAGASRLGYVIQGAVALVRPESPWRLRGDVLYQHVGLIGEDMRTGLDGAYRMRGDPESSTAAFVSAVLTGRRAKVVVPYLVAGLGVGWASAMSAATEMTAANGMHSGRGTARLAAQGGVGVEWSRRSRALSLEARVQTMRSVSGAGGFTTVPVTLGVSF